MENAEVGTENLGILGVDSSLEPYTDHFRYRVQKFLDQAQLIEKYEGGLEQFSQGDILYRHWHYPTKTFCATIGTL